VRPALETLSSTCVPPSSAISPRAGRSTSIRTLYRARVDLPDRNAPLLAQLGERIAALEARLAELDRKNDAAPSL
jgi:hypothetical protein